MGNRIDAAAEPRETVRYNVGLNPSANPSAVASSAITNSAGKGPLVLRMAALILLFSAPGLYESTHLSSLAAPEVWSHLRTGTWIVENRAIPRTGLFSQYPNLPWNDSSWGFNFLLGMAYKLFDLRAIPILLMLMKTALAVVTFLLARSGRA